MADSRKISEMRNLGPACEQDLNQAGIETAQQVIDLGVEETFYRMLAGRKQLRRDVRKCINASYLYALYGAIHDVDWREVPENKKNEFKELTRRIRGEI